jgi:hypothetical protein
MFSLTVQEMKTIISGVNIQKCRNTSVHKLDKSINTCLYRRTVKKFSTCITMQDRDISTRYLTPRLATSICQYRRTLVMAKESSSTPVSRRRGRKISLLPVHRPKGRRLYPDMMVPKVSLIIKRHTDKNRATPVVTIKALLGIPTGMSKAILDILMLAVRVPLRTARDRYKDLGRVKLPHTLRTVIFQGHMDSKFRVVIQQLLLGSRV